jgi:hypothetical protein
MAPRNSLFDAKQLTKTSVTEEPFPLVQAHIFAPIRGALYFQHLKKVK